MKTKLILQLGLGLSLCFGQTAKAETTADFETFPLQTGTYFGGPVTGGDTTFVDGNAEFAYKNSGYWSGGWIVSNVSDSVTSGYGNLGAARAGSGFNQSANYTVGQNNSGIKLTGMATGKQVSGAYVTNGTYAALSMANGDQFAKKFGGDQGTDEDWFLLTVKGYSAGIVKTDSVNFYLADFRSSNSSEDYIVTKWMWVDLMSLGDVDSLSFHLNSSDVGQWGMNTPAFFCLDNFRTTDAPTSVSDVSNKGVNVYPNPTSGQVQVEGLSVGTQYQILNANGETVHYGAVEQNNVTLDLSPLSAGLYFINLNENGTISQKKVLKL